MHFCAVVLGEDVDSQMEPYGPVHEMPSVEDILTGTYDKRVTVEDVTAEFAEVFKDDKDLDPDNAREVLDKRLLPLPDGRIVRLDCNQVMYDWYIEEEHRWDGSLICIKKPRYPQDVVYSGSLWHGLDARIAGRSCTSVRLCDLDTEAMRRRAEDAVLCRYFMDLKSVTGKVSDEETHKACYLAECLADFYGVEAVVSYPDGWKENSGDDWLTYLEAMKERGMSRGLRALRKIDMHLRVTVVDCHY